MRTFKFWLFYGVSVFFLLSALACLTLLFCSAQMWLRESREIQEVAPVTGSVVEARDSLMFVFEEGWGGAPPVVFIHGPGWGALWADTATPVAEADFRSLTIDLPPFGFSQKLYGAESYGIARQALRIMDVLAKMEIKEATFVCHSVGCQPVMEIAVTNPKFVKKLVLVDPELGIAGTMEKPEYGQATLKGMWRRLFSMHFIRNAILATYGTHPFSISSIMRSMVYDKRSISVGRIELLQAPLQIKHMTQAYGDWLEHLLITKENAYVTDFKNFKRVKAPALILWGEEDAVTPAWQGIALQKLLPNASLRIIPKAGHIPFIEQTNDFNRYLLRFLKGEPLGSN